MSEQVVSLRVSPCVSEDIVTCVRCRRKRQKKYSLYVLALMGYQCDPDLYQEYPDVQECMICEKEIEGFGSFVETQCGKNTLRACETCSRTKLWREQKEIIKQIVQEKNKML